MIANQDHCELMRFTHDKNLREINHSLVPCQPTTYMDKHHRPSVAVEAKTVMKLAANRTWIIHLDND